MRGLNSRAMRGMGTTLQPPMGRGIRTSAPRLKSAVVMLVMSSGEIEAPKGARFVQIELVQAGGNGQAGDTVNQYGGSGGDCGRYGLRRDVKLTASRPKVSVTVGAANGAHTSARVKDLLVTTEDPSTFDVFQIGRSGGQGSGTSPPAGDGPNGANGAIGGKGGVVLRYCGGGGAASPAPFGGGGGGGGAGTRGTDYATAGGPGGNGVGGGTPGGQGEGSDAPASGFPARPGAGGDGGFPGGGGGGGGYAQQNNVAARGGFGGAGAVRLTFT